MPGLSRAVELRAERRNLAERMAAIMAEPAGENGLLNAEQETEFDRLHERQELLAAEISEIEDQEQRQSERLDRLEALRAELKTSNGVKAGRQDTDDIDAETETREGPSAEQRYGEAFDRYLRVGMAELTPEDRTLVRGGFVGASDAAYTEGRAQAIAPDTKGGFLVPMGMMQPITQAMVQFGGMRRSRAQIIQTGDGRDIPWPTYDDTSNQGRILTENAAVSTTDVTFGQAVLHAYMYSSDFIKVPWALLQDSAFDLAALIGNIAGERVGRITNVHFTTGDGAAKPYGIATQASTGVTAASTSDFTVDELLDLKHAVDPAYRVSPEWMFNDSTLKVLKQKKDGEGRPLWMSGVATREPDTIDGDPYVVNQQVASIATGAKAVLYGDFSLYKIRDVSGMQLRRLDERFADNGQVAFLLFSRHDGVLVNAGQNPVQALVLA